MVYGLPYKGSKNIIAKRIVAALPSGTNFVDCCCGGGAIVQAATLSGKFKTVTGYDINKSIIGLLQATMVDFGKIDYENFPVVSKDRKNDSFPYITKTPQKIEKRYLRILDYSYFSPLSL